MARNFIKYSEETGRLSYASFSEESFLRMAGYCLAMIYEDCGFTATKKDYTEFAKTIANSMVAAFNTVVDMKEKTPDNIGYDSDGIFIKNLYIDEFKKQPDTKYTTLNCVLHDNDTIDLSTSGYLAYQVTVISFAAALRFFKNNQYNIRKARKIDIDVVYNEAEKLVDMFTNMLPLAGYNIEDFAE